MFFLWPYVVGLLFVHLSVIEAEGFSDGPSQYNLGVMYAKGTGGLEKNEKQAVKWYRKAADQGHALAQYKLGLIYAHSARTLRKINQKHSNGVVSRSSRGRHLHNIN